MFFYKANGGMSYNDVWVSSNGANWYQVTDHAPWEARIYHSTTVVNNTMVLMGGSGYIDYMIPSVISFPSYA